MPELPEVETLRRSLVQTIQGCVITKVSLSHRHRGVSDEALPVICGSQIEDIERLGKFLTFRIAFRHLVIHLGMSGRLLIRDAGTYRADSHDHVRISTDDNRLLVFQDHRRFGRVFLSPLDLSALPAMGPDPLRDPMSASNLSDILGRRRAAIKVLLMEQSLGSVDKACEGDSPDAGWDDSKLIFMREISYGPRPFERRRVGILRAVRY